MINEKMIMDDELDNVSGGGADGTLYHNIVPGDTLSKIAKNYGTSVMELMALHPNITHPDRIYAGDRIRIR
jgi:LysM repeat protein